MKILYILNRNRMLYNFATFSNKFCPLCAQFPNSKIHVWLIKETLYAGTLLPLIGILIFGVNPKKGTLSHVYRYLGNAKSCFWKSSNVVLLRKGGKFKFFFGKNQIIVYQNNDQAYFIVAAVCLHDLQYEFMVAAVCLHDLQCKF